jgi:hypothetical protein
VKATTTRDARLRISISGSFIFSLMNNSRHRLKLVLLDPVVRQYSSTMIELLSNTAIVLQVRRTAVLDARLGSGRISQHYHSCEDHLTPVRKVFQRNGHPTDG